MLRPEPAALVEPSVFSVQQLHMMLDYKARCEASHQSTGTNLVKSCGKFLGSCSIFGAGPKQSLGCSCVTFSLAPCIPHSFPACLVTPGEGGSLWMSEF